MSTPRSLLLGAGLRLGQVHSWQAGDHLQGYQDWSTTHHASVQQVRSYRQEQGRTRQDDRVSARPRRIFRREGDGEGHSRSGAVEQKQDYRRDG